MACMTLLWRHLTKSTNHRHQKIRRQSWIPILQPISVTLVLRDIRWLSWHYYDVISKNPPITGPKKPGAILDPNPAIWLVHGRKYSLLIGHYLYQRYILLQCCSSAVPKMRKQQCFVIITTFSKSWSLDSRISLRKTRRPLPWAPGKTQHLCLLKSRVYGVQWFCTVRLIHYRSVSLHVLARIKEGWEANKCLLDGLKGKKDWWRVQRDNEVWPWGDL